MTGVVGALGLLGVIYTQRRADAREDKRVAREDAHRTYEHRRAAYLALLKEFRRHHQGLKLGKESWNSDGARFLELGDLVEDVLVYGTAAGRNAALETAKVVLDESVTGLEEKIQAYRAQIRKDLGVRDELPS